MKLSVITMICDGTENLLEKWIKNADESITIEKELIVVDNTTEQTLPDHPKAKIVKAGHNAMQWAGRRLGVENATGEYVFLVDSDDEILPINHFEWTEDVVCFNYMARLENGTEDYICSEPYRLSYTASDGEFFDYAWRLATKNMVWNKFIKKDLLMSIYSNLPYFEISFMEDTLLNVFILAKAKSIRFEQKCFYKYFFGTGISTKMKYKSMDTLERLVKGMDTALSVFNLAFDKQAQEQSGITTVGFYRGCMTFALQKYENVSDELLEDYTNLISKYFEKDILLKVLKTLPEKELSRKTMLKAKHCINDYMSN